jgi:hypothetical protein
MEVEVKDKIEDEVEVKPILLVVELVEEVPKGVNRMTLPVTTLHSRITHTLHTAPSIRSRDRELEEDLTSGVM